jgi:uncharacterized protein
VIKLDILKQTDSRERALEKGYIYKDIKLDMEFSRYVREELYAESEPKDLNDLLNEQAVFNSVKNILSTSPGQKLLNPEFGLDLRDYLFEPISTRVAFFIAQDVYFNLGQQEPRITVNGVEINADEDNNQYSIDIYFSVPTLDVYGLNLKGSLNKDGYVLI